MIRSIDTLKHHFNLLQKKQEMVSTNISNLNTPDFESLRMIQSTSVESQLANRMGQPNRGKLVTMGNIPFSKQVSEVYRLPEVNLVDEMAEMIKISRDFEANQKVLHASDETLRRASSEIGKV